MTYGQLYRHRCGQHACDATGDEPVWRAGEVVGWVTSGGYAHHSEASVALGYVPAELADWPGRFEIEIVGTRRPAKLVSGCRSDPEGHPHEIMSQTFSCN